ncbi:MAG TPA: Crp/Fnr family transcriptional regulator [Anaerolineales bacterium]
MTANPTPKPESSHYLRGVDLFQDLDEAGLERVAQAARRRRVSADSYLIHQGDPATHLHVLLAGRLKLTQVTVDGQQVLLRYVNPGEAFAVLAVLADTLYPTSVQAVEDSQVAAWDKDTMQKLMLQHPSIALRAMAILARHTREFQDRIRELSTERVERRIARTLLRLVRQTGRKVKDGVLLDLPISRQDLAEMTGTTLYTVSRTLSHWETQGLIRSGREKIVILFPHGLVTIAEDLPPGLASPGTLDE